MTPADTARLAEIRARLAKADEMSMRFLGSRGDSDMDFLLRLVDEATGWRPIATAPKDGARILLATKSGHVTVGHWLDNSRTQWPWQGWSTDRGPFTIDGVNGWQPLPPPPEIPHSDAGGNPGDSAQGEDR